MALRPEQIIVAGTGNLYWAPEDTPMPTSLTGAIHSAFSELGYTTEDGAKFTDEKDTNDVRPWQSFYPVRTHITARSGMLEFSLLQWNQATVMLAFGGGAFTEPVPGEFRYTPPEPSELAIRAMVLDFVDGDRNYRFGIERGFVVSNTESTFAKSGPALLPITFRVLAAGENPPWTMDSDDPAYGELVS